MLHLNASNKGYYLGEIARGNTHIPLGVTAINPRLSRGIYDKYPRLSRVIRG